MGSTFELTVQRSIDGRWPVVAEHHRTGQLLPVWSEGQLILAGEPASASPSRYGRALGEALFTGPIRDSYVAARGDAPVRVWLCVEDPALRTWRWEWLFAPVDGNRWDFLSLDQRALYSLYLPSLTDRPYPPIGRHDLRTLLLVANPTDSGGRFGLASFDAASVVARLQDVFNGRLPRVPSDVLARVMGAVGPPNLDALVTQLTAGTAVGPYSILHVVCHGRFDRASEETWLYFEQATLDHQDQMLAAAQPISASELISRLARVRQLPYLVFLSVCESSTPEAEQRWGGLAQRLVRELGIPAVIGMTEPVSMATAQALSHAFYQRLLDQSDTGAVDRALVEAYAGLASRPDVHVPALYSRLGAQPLFSLAVDRVLTINEIRTGLERLDSLIAQRAPILQPQFAKQRQALELLQASGAARLGSEPQKTQETSLTAITEICQEVLDLSFHALIAGGVVPAYDDRQPFRGLSPFRLEDQAFFFGRDALIETLARKIAEDSFLPVLGPSGSGKSSVVLAGLVPRLQQQDSSLQVLYLTPGSAPLEQLQAVEATLHDGPALYVVDQFEEVFTACRQEAQRRDFINAVLARAARAAVVLTMRADFWGDCANYFTLKTRMQARQELIAPMTTADLRTAIEQQAATVGLRFEADLSHTMLDEVAYEPGAMPLLQHALLELWKRRHGRWLRAAEHRAIGGVRRAIAETAERLYAELTPSEQGRMRDIFLRLTHLDEQNGPGEERRDTRRRVSLADLVPAQSNPDTTRALVKRLADAVLVTTSRNPLTGQQEVEVAHEALIRHWARFRGWLESNREQLRLRDSVRDAAAEWTEHDTDGSFLVHRGRRLEAAEELLHDSQLALTDQERRYLQACAGLREREAAVERRRADQDLESARARQREAEAVAAREASFRREEQHASKTRIRISIATALLAIAVITAVLFFRRAQQQTTLNQAVLQVTESRAALDRSPVTALSLALRAMVAVRDSDTAQRLTATNNLRSILAETRGIALNPNRKGINAIAVSTDHKWVATAHDDGAALICTWPLSDDFSRCTVVQHADPVIDVRIAGSRWVVTATDERWKARVKDRAAEVWGGADSSLPRLFLSRLNGGPGAVVRPIELPLDLGEPRAWSLSSDGQWIAVGCDDGRVLLWQLGDRLDNSPTASQSVDGSPIMSVTFGPTPGQFAVGTVRGSVQIWMIEAGRLVRKAALPNQTRSITALAFTLGGDLLVTGTGFSHEPLRSADSAGSAGMRGVIRRHGNAIVSTWKIGGIDGSPTAPRQEFTIEDNRVESLQPSDDASYLLVGATSYSSDRHSLLKRRVLRGRVFDIRKSRTDRGDANPGPPMASASLANPDSALTQLAFMPQSSVAVSSSNTGDLQLSPIFRDSASAALRLPQRRFRAHTAQVTSFAIIDRQIVTASLDGILRVWDLDGWRFRSGPFSLPGHVDGVAEIQTDPSGRWLATRSHRTVTFWDTKPVPPKQVAEHSGYGIVFAPDRRAIVYEGDSFTVVPLPPINRYELPSQGQYFALSQSGRFLATGEHEKAIVVWDLANDADLRNPKVVPAINTRTAFFSRDEAALVTIGHDSIGRFWRIDRATGQLDSKPAGQFTIPRRFMDAHVAHSGSFLITEESRDDKKPGIESRASSPSDSLYLWKFDFSSARVTKSRLLVRAGTMPGVDAKISPDGLWMVRGMWERGLDVNTQELILPRLMRIGAGDQTPVVLEGPTDLPRAVAFSPDSKMLAVGSGDSSLDLWSLKNQPLKVTRIREHSDSVDAVEFSADGKFFASASQDGTARLWRTDSLEVGSETFEGRQGLLDVVHLSANGRLYAGGESDSVLYWNLGDVALIADACEVIVAAVKAGDRPSGMDEVATICSKVNRSPNAEAVRIAGGPR